jgi:hypothetical protein
MVAQLESINVIVYKITSLLFLTYGTQFSKKGLMNKKFAKTILMQCREESIVRYPPES